MKECFFRGVPISEGIAIGRLCLLIEEKALFPDFPIDTTEVEKEITRYRKALSSSRSDLERLQRLLMREGSKEAITILDSHIQMLEDPVITTTVEMQIGQMLRNTETVFNAVMQQYESAWRQIDETAHERLLDVRDLSNRILKHLNPVVPNRQTFPFGSVLCAKQLTPSDIVERPTAELGGLITEFGGKTSHAALIAQAKGIPYVARVNLEELKAHTNSIVIVDGTEGLIVVNPEPGTIERYQKLLREREEEIEVLRRESHFASLTADEYSVDVYANIESLDDLIDIASYQVAGIGLCRTEYLFPGKDLFRLSEEEQYAVYEEVVKRSKGLPVVFRVFDVGNDKDFSEMLAESEPNPALGLRAIRFLLANPHLLKTQLRALIRTSQIGEIKLLFPFISDVVEMRESKRLYFQVLGELNVSEHIPIGAMIEVPSAVLTCDAIARECDFLSIGTNDLIQYTLASDRLNPRITDLYKPIHPSIIQMIHLTCVAARRQNVHLSLCGEIASNPLFIPLLLGLGVKSFSCSLRAVPFVKRCIRETSLASARKIASQVLELETAKEVEVFIKVNRSVS